jgi:NAD+ kinase|tara:strand:- start:932 stop:1696 length:765 start_codon:yes stop_codon:yes gene_type:complete
MKFKKPHFIVDYTKISKESSNRIQSTYKFFSLSEADAIVVLGGDGFMLDILKRYQDLDLPFYGINKGTVGFLMNQNQNENLLNKLNQAEETIIHPLKMHAKKIDGSEEDHLAINEISILRSGSQAAKLKIVVDNLVRLEELVCDGALVSTPAGSTAYNYSAHGPILPIDSNILALTAMAAFRPRRWRGALIPSNAKIEFFIKDSNKRPVSAYADSKEVKNISSVKIESEDDVYYKLLFDKGHGLQERILREQFF